MRTGMKRTILIILLVIGAGLLLMAGAHFYRSFFQKGGRVVIHERQERISKEERVKAAVVNAFGKIKDNTATLVLLNELKSEADQIYKNKVTVSLGEIGDSRAIADLSEYLKRLKRYEPEDPTFRFQWEYAVKTAEEAIRKIQEKQ